MRRHAPIPPLTVELAPTYRCGARGKRYLTKHGAYVAIAREIFFALHDEPHWKLVEHVIPRMAWRLRRLEEYGRPCKPLLLGGASRTPVPRLTVELTPLYSFAWNYQSGTNGRRHRTMYWVYLAAAYGVFDRVYRCKCDHSVGWYCDRHGGKWDARRHKTAKRLARFLRFRDGRQRAREA